jgi:hypothetical protein
MAVMRAALFGESRLIKALLNISSVAAEGCPEARYM